MCGEGVCGSVWQICLAEVFDAISAEVLVLSFSAELLDFGGSVRQTCLAGVTAEDFQCTTVGYDFK